MRHRHLPFQLLLSAALVALGAVAPAHATGFTDWRYDLGGLGYHELKTFGTTSGSTQLTTTVPTGAPLTPSPGGSVYIDARSSYQLAGCCASSATMVPGGPTPVPIPMTLTAIPPLPENRNYLDVQMDTLLIDPGTFEFIGTGAQAEQPYVGVSSIGASTALAEIQHTVNATITFAPGTTTSVDVSAILGIQVSSGSMFDFTSIQVGSDGSVQVFGSPGLTATETSPGSGIWVISGTFTSPAFQAPTDGSIGSWTTTTFVEVDINGLSLTGSAIVNAGITIDSSNTIVSNIVSLDPNATFSLPIPEPATLVLLGLGLLGLVARPRPRK